MILGGRSCSTSSFILLSRKGSTCLCSASIARAPGGRGGEREEGRKEGREGGRKGGRREGGTYGGREGGQMEVGGREGEMEN